MSGFKFYSWTVSLDDGSRFSYDFEVHQDDPWTTVLRKFGRFLEGEGYLGVSDRIEDICDEFENSLDARIDAEDALRKYFTEKDGGS